MLAGGSGITPMFQVTYMPPKFYVAVNVAASGSLSS